MLLFNFNFVQKAPKVEHSSCVFFYARFNLNIRQQINPRITLGICASVNRNLTIVAQVCYKLPPTVPKLSTSVNKLQLEKGWAYLFKFSHFCSQITLETIMICSSFKNDQLMSFSLCSRIIF